ncbi:MAG: GNAT family N-acetyltransferase [Gammaproteobacteria bacterium]|nr:GNAT family N-acetyltransferase [Gammaproteobacteria bacterium]
MNDLTSRYPRTISREQGEVEVRLMAPGDEGAVAAFAQKLPEHDLLFLRRDITQPKVLSAWVNEIESGSIVSLLALQGGDLIGCSAIVRDTHSWSPHVGELRVLVSAQTRDHGVGRILIQESFIVALTLGVEKLTAQMTADQLAAIGVFEGMGFRPEALLRDHVRGRDGVKHDIVILSHDVDEFQSKMQAYGLTEAF